MAHYAVVCPEDAGHLLSVGGLGSELARRGHKVTLVGRARAAPLAEQLGLPVHELSADDVPWPSTWLLGTTFWLFGAGWKIGMRNSLRWRTEVLLRRLPPALQALQVEGVVTDQILPGAATVAEHLGLPFVTVCSAMPWNQDLGVPPPFTHWDYAEGTWPLLRNRLAYAGWHWYMRPVLTALNRQRRAWKLRALKHIDETYSPLVQICQLCPEMDFPRRKLPATFHYVGPLAADRPASRDGFPWDRLDGRPLIFASLGTISDPENVAVLRRIPAACAGLDAQLVLALGKWNNEDGHSVREEFANSPCQPIVVDFAPQLELLDRADLLITHAGINTVMEALTRAVPMVALPRSADQPGMGARVAYAGVGLRGSFHRSTPAQIRRLVQQVLAEGRFRDRAKQMQQAIAASGGVQRAADLVEQALTTGRPVVRQ